MPRRKGPPSSSATSPRCATTRRRSTSPTRRRNGADNPGNELIRATGEVAAIAGAAPPQTALSLDLLGSYSDPEPADAIADPRRDYQAQYAAQHSQADARPWSKVERDPGSKARPVVYSARGSHASYFEPGLHWATVWFDHADGKGFSREMALETLRDGQPPWIQWPGR